jgi:hypothetical protein
LSSINTALAAVTLELTRIQGTHSNINANIIEMTKNVRRMAKGIDDLKVMLGSLVVASSVRGATMSALTANRSKTKLFSIAASYENPTVPPYSQTLEEEIYNAKTMEAATKASALVNQMQTEIAYNLKNLIKDTTAYKTVSDWLSSIADEVAVYIPDSLKDAESKVNGNAGVPTT